MDYKHIFSSDYRREAFAGVINDIFTDKFEWLKDIEAIKADKSLAKDACRIGKIITSDKREIAVYEVRLQDGVQLSRNRVAIRNLLRNSWKDYDGAFIAGYQDKNPEWRFSFLSETKELGADGYLEKRATQAKRYTYLLGGDNVHRTAVERFCKLKDSKKELKDIIDAFSVEALTKEFYNKLFAWYTWAVSKESGVTFPMDPNTDKDDREKINVKIIRMITRILFVWFIKQKNLVPDLLFDESRLKDILKEFNPVNRKSGNYYNAILQNLFFATLNRAVIDDEGNPRRFALLKEKRDLRNLYRYSEMFAVPENEVLKIFERVPFLNGGLFECLDKFSKADILQDVDILYDGFSRNDKKSPNGNYKYRAFVPNILFFNNNEPKLGLLNILKQYNFTVEENTSNDMQVSLDPELLGRVFENLLAEYNPETQESARKATGSFYTPRTIVDYMAEQSLAAYLGDETDKNKIINKLLSVKILDPACGSGAFPMGCLSKIVEKIETLKPNHYNHYDLKLKIIENCIYGVDIQPIAMLISKLRFFISLICEQNDIDFSNPENNYGVNTLPNLETKFVAANTLMSAKIHSYGAQQWLNDDKLEILKNELLDIRHEHFNAKSQYKKEKNRIKDEEKRLQIQSHIAENSKKINKEKILILQDQITKKEREIKKYKGENWTEEWITPQPSFFETQEPTLFRRDINKERRESVEKEIASYKTEINKEQKKSIPQGFEAAVEQITKWNPYDQNSSSPFFDPEWMFGVPDGFDIVIGNPPYINLSKNKNLSMLYEHANYETFNKNGDIYCLFYEKGNQLLKNGGHLCFITSNKWMRTESGESTRKFFVTNTNPIQLIDFAGIKVFESATVDTNILLFSKAKNKGKTLCSISKNISKDSLKDLSDFMRHKHNHIICNFSTSDSWVILNPIEQRIKAKIESIGTPLKDWDIQINYGIKTGCNGKPEKDEGIFIISKKQRENILKNCKTKEERKRTDELIRPILRGRDIKRYSYNWAGLYLIATFPSKNYDIEQYPAVKQHLISFGLKRLEQTGKKYIINGKIIKARKKTNNKWFETQDSISYWDDFFKPKIVYPETTQSAYFAFDKTGLFIDKTCFMLISEYAKYLQITLSSTLFEYAYKRIFSSIELGQNGYQYNKHALIKLPIKIPTETELSRLNEINASGFNEFIFNLYNLSEEEINLIKNKKI